MTRKIIQISTVAQENDGAAVLFALCDDGTVWWHDEQEEDHCWREVNTGQFREPAVNPSARAITINEHAHGDDHHG